MARVFPCWAAACCLFYLLLAHLPPPAQGRRPAGSSLAAAAGGGLGGRRLLHLVPAVPEPRFVPTQAPAAEERRGGGVPVTTKARPRPAAWSVTAPELRAVPGGPDPLHHHGGSPSRRPDQDHTPSP